MKNLKMKLLLPMAIFMIAIAAAFASKKGAEDELAPEQGYIIIDDVCKEHGTCDNKLQPMICTDHSERPVFGLNETNCLKVLYSSWKPQIP